MKDNCYIDGVSTWNRFGIWITKGGYNELLSFPEMKEPPTNDWPEEDGIEVDLSSPRLMVKEAGVTFISSRESFNVIDFIDFLSTPGYHSLFIPSLNRSWSIRLLSNPAIKMYKSATPFTIRFAEDNPTIRVNTSPYPGMSIVGSSYAVDDVPLDFYGVIVDKGKVEVLKAPTVKMNLNREIRILDGRIYDAEKLYFNSKEVTFNCRLKASSVDNFWSCYDSFFGKLMEPDERRLYVDFLMEEFPCYYKRSSGFKIITLSPVVMVQFDLTLVFTVFRIDGIDYVLATEDDFIVVSEDGEFYLDVKEYGT
ncbi:hypothetical protein LJC39_01865 [Parabacteroides sp. OttesenSCG-928-B22]|nr:hypothetical protein [Parabacteroides sp. OttesenSCG-928-B22]